MELLYKFGESPFFESLMSNGEIAKEIILLSESLFLRDNAETRPPREREPGSGLELTPKSYK
jgi:hypothetical protein